MSAIFSCKSFFLPFIVIFYFSLILSFCLSIFLLFIRPFFTHPYFLRFDSIFVFFSVRSCFYYFILSDKLYVDSPCLYIFLFLSFDDGNCKCPHFETSTHPSCTIDHFLTWYGKYSYLSSCEVHIKVTFKSEIRKDNYGTAERKKNQQLW